jgi:uncharacterized protein (TIGR03437 family)
MCAQGYVRSVTPAGIPLLRADVSRIQMLVNGSLQAGQVNRDGALIITAHSDPLEALRLAMAQWSRAAGSTIRFNGIQTTSASVDPNDGKFVVTAEDTPEIRSVIGSALGLTYWSYAADGTILDTDIMVNPKYGAAFSTNQATGTWDLEALLVHELGHALGANHSPVVGAAMFYSQSPCDPFTRPSECSAYQTLSEDELAFAAAVYPGSSSTRGSLTGKVTFSNGEGVLGAVVIAVDPSTGVTVGGLASLDDGSYQLNALPAGSYQVYAEPADGPFQPDQVAAFLPNASRMNQTFRTTFAGGNTSPSLTAVTAGGTARVDITASSVGNADVAATGLGSAQNTDWATTGGRVQAIPSGQAVDVLLWGKGLDASVTQDQIRLIGPGLKLRPGTLKTAPDAAFLGFTPLRFTIEIAARATSALATIVVAKDNDAAAFTGGLILLPAVSSPAITSVSPNSAPVGGSAFTLTVNGSDFTQVTTVVLDGSPLPTTFANASQLTASAAASDLVRAGTVQVYVFDFASLKGSNSVPFAIGGSGGGAPAISAIQNGASFLPGIAAGSWVTIRGSNLSNTNPGRTWRADEVVGGRLPASLDGVSVTINGRAASVYFISPTQLNVLVPPDAAAGTASLIVTNNGTSSAPAEASMQKFSPALFQYGGANGIATRYPDNALIGNPAVVPGTVAAKPNDVLILWGTGFGPTSPAAPAGLTVASALTVTTLPSVSIAGATVTVLAAALSPGSAGLYQIAIQLPATLPATGDVDIRATAGGVSSPAGVKIFVSRN